MIGLKGRSVIVTGAARGIGEGIAARLALEGVSVVVNDVDADGTARVVRSIESRGGKAIAAIGDVSKDADATRIVRAAVDAFGGLHGLVNNAGVDVSGAPGMQWPEVRQGPIRPRLDWKIEKLD